MSRHPKIRGWKAVATLTAILALIILLLPHAPNHHAAPDLIFLLIPVFLFAALNTGSAPHYSQTERVTASQSPARPSLFQRPPPTLA